MQRDISLQNLSEHDIFCICTKNPILKKHLAGILPRNYHIIKKDIQIPSYYIINNGSSQYAGDHWLLQWYGSKIHTFFDPMGFSDDDYNYREIVEFKGLPVQRNVRFIQTFGSSVCANHCIYVAYMLTLGFEFSTILNQFYSKDTIKNDKVVYDFLKKIKNDGRK